jgi:hypothetical protein
MVHALKEAWRVLTPNGIMIDVRPLSVDSPLDIVFKEKSIFAGLLDMSPGIKHDIAADKAIQEVVNKKIFKELQVERFELAYYWKTVKGMVADIRKRWQDDIILDENVFQHAYKLFRKHRPNAKVRLLLQMKLAKYEKQSRSA